mgnify:CR=1 FL=1
MNLNTARVFVRDIASARRFYLEMLGLRIMSDESSHGFCVFQAGSSNLVVEEVPEDAPQEEQSLVGRFTGLSFDVPNANAAYEDLLSRGVKFSGAPEKQFWGGTLATFQDPSGNELQICEQPMA